MAKLGIMCDKEHEHLPWGVMRKEQEFATAEERKYPLLLCRRWAKLVALAAEVKPAAALPQAHLDKAATSRQPRRGMQEIIPEYKEIVELVDCSSANLEELKRHLEAKSPINWRGLRVSKR